MDRVDVIKGKVYVNACLGFKIDDKLTNQLLDRYLEALTPILKDYLPPLLTRRELLKRRRLLLTKTFFT